MEVQRIGNRLVLIIGCSMLAFLGGIGQMRLTAGLCAFILSCSGVWLEDSPGKIIFQLLYGIGSLLIPEFALMLPMLLYEIMQSWRDTHSSWRDGFLGVAQLMLAGTSLYLARGQLKGWEAAGILFFLVLAVWLEWNSRQYLALKERHIAVRDTGKEENLLLQSRNQYLIEKQDSEVYTATLRERNRIAREIHDNVGHLLSRALLVTGAMLSVNREEAMAGKLIQLKETLDEAMDSIRQSVHDLHEESIDVEQSIREIVRVLEGYQVEVDYDMEQAPSKVKYCLIAVVKEAVSNVIRHSDGDRIRIALIEHPAFWQLEVTDNGMEKGGRAGTAMAAEAEAGGNGTGIGLENIRERVEGLSGVLQMRRDLRGFSVFATIPKGR